MSDWASIRLPMGCVKRQYEHNSFIVLQGAVGRLAGYSFSCSNKMLYMAETVRVKLEEPFGTVEFLCDRIVVKKDKVITLKKGELREELTGAQLAELLQDCVKNTAQTGLLYPEGIGKAYHDMMILGAMENAIVRDFSNDVASIDACKQENAIIPSWQAPPPIVPYAPPTPQKKTFGGVVKSVLKHIALFFLKFLLLLVYLVLKLVWGLLFVISVLGEQVCAVLGGLMAIIAVLFFIFGEPFDGIKVLGISAAVAGLPYVAIAVLEPMGLFIDTVFEFVFE